MQTQELIYRGEFLRLYIYDYFRHHQFTNYINFVSSEDLVHSFITDYEDKIELANIEGSDVVYHLKSKQIRIIPLSIIEDYQNLVKVQKYVKSKVPSIKQNIKSAILYKINDLNSEISTLKSIKL